MNRVRLHKIATAITAGGGAGIDFQIVSTDGLAVYTLVADLSEEGALNSYSLTPVSNNIRIDRFTAEGYMDGGEYDGRFLFADTIEIGHLDEFIVDTLNDCFARFDDSDFNELRDELKNGVKMTITVADGHADNSMMFRGWLRGILEAGDTIEFNNLMGVSFEGTQASWIDADFDGTLIATLTEEGANWYKTVFIDGDEY